MDLTCPVGRDDDERRLLGAERAELGDRNLEVGEHLQQEPLELLVSAVELVDQQHRGLAVGGFDGLEQRTLYQEFLAEQLLLSLAFADPVGRLQHSNLEELPRVVPLVHRLVDVQTLVALQPDQPGIEGRGEHLGDLGLAHACLTLQEQRTPELQRQIDGYRQAAVGNVQVIL